MLTSLIGQGKIPPSGAEWIFGPVPFAGNRPFFIKA